MSPGLMSLTSLYLIASVPQWSPGTAGQWGVVGKTPQDTQVVRYADVIRKVEAMPSDADLQQRSSRLGLNIMNVMWEDTGRGLGSAIGPNISDLTLQVREPFGRGSRTHLLPVIRYPNFTDKTGDVRADKLWVRVGNQNSDGELSAVPLTDVLKNLRKYLTRPGSLRGSDNFLAKRDSHFLVSAQHVFVPVPKGGKAEFTPVLFNYQSAPGSPAVLTLLVTREGMSATVIENKGGSQSEQTWGQQLYFNHEGQRTVFTAERKSDVETRIESGRAKASDEGALEEGADMLMVVQIPLKHKQVGYLPGIGGGMASMGAMEDSAAPSKAAEMQAPSAAKRERDDVEQAVIGHGEDQGPFAEMAGLKLERDDSFPVRVTVQFYRATSNGVVSQKSLADVKKMIDRVYADADYVGSLVVPENDRKRPTEWNYPVAPRPVAPAPLTTMIDPPYCE